MAILEPSTDVPPLPGQPPDVAWPTAEWPTGPLPAGVDNDHVWRLIDRAFGPDPDASFGESHATLVVKGGRLVVERYGSGSDASTPLLSWSMAKSVLHAIVGILVDQGKLDPHAPAPVPEWQEPTDPRHQITLDHLLRMADGLNFNESYEIPEPGTNAGDAEWSHAIDMLFGAGVDDHGSYTATRPPAHPPGTVFNYSSGTSNVVSRIVCDHIGRDGDATAWMGTNLFDPIGMRSATPSFDTSGTFVGSSYLHATARDWARFGLLYLRGGLWDGHRIVPSSWVEQCRLTRAVDSEGAHYGTHWWTAEDRRGTFYASGYEFQRVVCVPTSDLVVVRLGKTPEDSYETPKAWLNELIAAFD